MVIKNLWSLTVDEAIAAEKISEFKLLKKNHQVFFPINSQLKDIDLILYNLKTQKTKSIQVKGSRTYNPQKKEIREHGEGSTSWFRIKRNKIYTPENKIDFFIFVLHWLDMGNEKSIKNRKITQQCLVIPIDKFRRKTIKKSLNANNTYTYNFFISLDGKRIGDIAQDRQGWIDYTEFLNKFELLQF